MQGDLISRSELIKWIPFWGGDIESMLEYIANMETAYDVEKVVAELKEVSYNGFDLRLSIAEVLVRNGGKE